MSLLALLAVCSAGVGGCAETQKADEGFTQSREYESVLQGDRAIPSWKKISREPSAIATPAVPTLDSSARSPAAVSGAAAGVP